jgi:hypothetical protein
MRSTPAAVHYVVTTTSQTSTPRTSARCWRVQRRRPSMRDAGTTNTLNQPRSHLQVVLNDCKHNCGGTQTRREKLDDHTVDPMRTTAPYACATTCGREPAANYCARYWRARRRINVCRKKARVSGLSALASSCAYGCYFITVKVARARASARFFRVPLISLPVSSPS